MGEEKRTFLMAASSCKALVCLILVLDKHKGGSGLQQLSLFYFLLLYFSMYVIPEKYRSTSKGLGVPAY